MRRDGSVTVYATLSLMLVASFILALLEAGRVYGIECGADMTTEVGIESVFAEYESALWQNYSVLGLDAGYGSKILSIGNVASSLTAKLGSNLDMSDKENELLGIALSDAQIAEYKLITDGDGKVFLSYLSDNWTKRLAVDVSASYEKYKEQEVLEEQQSDDSSIEEADAAVESEKQAKATEEAADHLAQVEQSGGGESSSKATAGVSDVENPLKVVLEWKRNALLGMVVGDVGTLSTKSADVSESLTKRAKSAGTAAVHESVSAADRIIAMEYMDEYFKNYTDSDADGPLSYEMEYIICGAESDKANLEGVATRLLALRESSNIIHIVGDSEKRILSESLANAIAGFTLNPAIIKLVQTAIIAAWAYLESIQDVRALLSGDKIALIKNKEQWTIDLNNLGESFRNTTKAKSCENGLTYTEYLKGFISLESESTLAYRMMDLMEMRVRAIPGHENFRMDNVLIGMKCACTYRAVPLFSQLAVIGSLGIGEYRFIVTKEFAY
jgi:hypothetical protein